MDLDNDMQVLISKIKAPSIFYLPRKLFERALEKNLIELEDLGIFNNLFLIDTNGKNKPINNASELLYLIDKDKVLKSNVFQLLTLKTQLDKDSFHYLLIEYLKELTSWIRVIEMVKNDAKVDLKYYKLYFQSYLDIQHTHLVDHQNELTEKFGHWKIEFEIGRIFNNPNFTLRKVKENPEKFYGDKEKKTDKKEKDNDELKQEKLTGKTSKLSEKDVDDYLLEKIFNVNSNSEKQN